MVTGDTQGGANRDLSASRLQPFARVRSDRWAGRWFVAVLGGLFVLAVALRILFALTAATPLDPGHIGDQYYYRTYAASLADGHGISESLDGVYVPGALHAPGLSVVLAAADLVGLRSPTEQRVAMAVVCSIGVVLVGLVGRRLGGPTLGLVAAFVAAVHPGWVQAGPDLLSEGLYMVAISAAMLAALLFLDRPSWRRGLVVGLAIAGTALVRSEGALLVVGLGIPLALVAAGRNWRRGLLLLGSVAVGAALLIMPWMLRNQSRLGGLAFTTNQGATVVGANCPDTYAGPRMGGFSHRCWLLSGLVPGISDQHNAVDRSRALQRIGVEYASDHASRLPVVAVARFARGWGVYASQDALTYDIIEDRNPGWQRAGQYVHWVLLSLALVGAVLLPRRSWSRWLVPLAPVVTTSVVFVLFYGSTRFRSGAEPSIALFAAAGVVGLAARFWPDSSEAGSIGGDAPDPDRTDRPGDAQRVDSP